MFKELSEKWHQGHYLHWEYLFNEIVEFQNNGNQKTMNKEK